VLHRQQIGAGERIADALIEEVTVTAVQVPVNAGARVMLLRDDEIGRPATIVRHFGTVIGVR
jgi:hypothetical protein